MSAFAYHNAISDKVYSLGEGYYSIDRLDAINTGGFPIAISNIDMIVNGHVTSFDANPRDSRGLWLSSGQDMSVTLGNNTVTSFYCLNGIYNTETTNVMLFAATAANYIKTFIFTFNGNWLPTGRVLGP